MLNLVQSILHLHQTTACVRIAYLRRKGHLPPLVCLHGFGSTKEDYADLSLHPAFAGRELVSLDAPGFGASSIDVPQALSIPFLVQATIDACDELGLDRFHICGHSMGGLTALKVAQKYSDRVLSFIDIEGNVAPEDCFLSRQIIEYPSDDANAFLTDFTERVAQRAEYSSRLYARALPLTVNASSVHPIFTSMVDLSDNTPLMDIFIGLRCPKTFVYGEQNRHLSYLGDLRQGGVKVVEIPLSGHFPMYSNPPALWDAIAEHLTYSEAAE